jgi:hypothetical protein
MEERMMWPFKKKAAAEAPATGKSDEDSSWGVGGPSFLVMPSFEASQLEAHEQASSTQLEDATTV